MADSSILYSSNVCILMQKKYKQTNNWLFTGGGGGERGGVEVAYATYFAKGTIITSSGTAFSN